jgi:hypothetical protein
MGGSFVSTIQISIIGTISVNSANMKAGKPPYNNGGIQ